MARPVNQSTVEDAFASWINEHELQRYATTSLEKAKSSDRSILTIPA
jgi:hypothetical protein